LVEYLTGPVAVDLATVPLPLTAAGLFGSDRPFEIELGSGKGRFLQEWSALHPEIGLLGVERAHKYAERSARRAVKHDAANVRMLFTTAEDLLFRCLAPASVDAFHVYYPDPWPKKRHNKRRFVRPDNVARLAVVLKPGGLLRVKTDHAGYADAIAEVLAGEPGLERVDVESAFAGLPATSFELKYAVEGRRTYRFAARRVSARTENE
jgi:tRNA (guanine-N7-)-methyltransferase